MSAILTAVNLVKTYTEGRIAAPVLKGLNLAVPAQQLTAVVGRSGSGKSTLLHILGTLDRPTSGELWFEDQNVLKLSDKARAQLRVRHLGFVYQFHHLLMDFTALENVELPLLIAGVPESKARAQAAEYLEKVGLKDKLHFRPSELSGGQRQRVAIARALCPQPDLILADEPTGNLDEANAAQIFRLFETLVRQERRAVVMVTHDQSLAAKCDHVFVLENGRGAFKGAADDAAVS